MASPTEAVHGWDAQAEGQVRTWMHIAQLNSAINELAALYYTKANRVGLVIISILTIVVGSRGIAALITGGVSAAGIVISACEIALGICASLLSLLELKTKSVAFSKRAAGYSKLAMGLRVQLILQPEERQHKTDLLLSIPERVEHLDDIAEPLPLRYRDMAQRSIGGGIVNMWSRHGTAVSVHVPVDRGVHQGVHQGVDQAQTPTTVMYDADRDVEHGADAILSTIMAQRL